MGCTPVLPWWEWLELRGGAWARLLCIVETLVI